jgi:uncharacterized protein (TIGR02301 family)
MHGPAQRLLRLGFGACALAVATMALAPIAEAQSFWDLFNNEAPRRPKRPVKPTPPPGDDLPPIVPRTETSAPPPPDDRPYDNKLLRLAEILGAVHYLRELCGAQDGQLWREQMRDILKNEGTTAVRRAKLVNSFNDGYRGYRRTYRTCTSSATLAVTRFSTEGAQIAAVLAAPSHFANRGPSNDITAPQDKQETSPGADKSGALPADQAKPGQPDRAAPAKKSTAPQVDQAKPGQPDKKGTSPQADASKPNQGAQGATPAKPARHPAN